MTPSAETPNDIHVRIAVWDVDRDALMQVRESVFIREQNVPAEIEIDALDPLCVHALASDSDGGPIGAARLDASGHIGRVAVLAAWRRLGIGRLLMELLIDCARARGGRRIDISAQVQAMPFYVNLGFVASGDVYAEAGIPHRQMHLTLVE